MPGRNPEQRQRNRNRNQNHGRREHQQGFRGNKSSRQQFSPCPYGLTRENMQAISAPYNFVPLADWVHIPEWSRQVSHDWPFKDGYSGEIRYSLIAESPLLVGGRQDTNKATDRPNTEVRPFRLPDGRYAIPGSSLKGLIRAVVEIAGFGRMRMVDNMRPGLRDISGPHVKKAYTDRVRNQVKAGFLRLRDDGGREILPARMTRLPHSALETAFGMRNAFFRKGQTVAEKYQVWHQRCQQRGWPSDSITFDLAGNEATHIGQGEIEGFPVFTGQISDSRQPDGKGKKRDFIFYEADEHHPIDVPDDAWRDFLLIHGDQKPSNRGMPWPDHWKRKFRAGEKVPVFYLEDGGKIRIGLAYMPKLAGDFSIHDCIDHVSEEHLGSAPGIGRYDLADLLFGAVNGNEQKDALRGRVSFETALSIDARDPDTRYDTILNGPKPTYFPNYLRQQTDPTTEFLQGHEDTQYSTYVLSPGNTNPRIRGFKRYPARKDIEVQALNADQESNRQVQIRLHPLSKGASFEGRITFHNLKREELGALFWALTWGGDPGLRHGLGMGKPFGFGQVCFEIDENKSHIQPNDADMEEALSQEKQQAFMDAFVHYMEEAAREHGGWKDSPQIRNLLAMADPAAADELPPGMELRHMKLMRCKDSHGKLLNINEFLWARQKTPALVLGDYATVTQWPTRATQERWRQKQAEGLEDEIASSNLHPWLQKQLTEICGASHATDLDALMRHKKLFKAWKEIGDIALKKAVFEHILSVWKERNWWDNPENKSMRQLRGKYEREAGRL